jgi:hypothetical protein
MSSYRRWFSVSRHMQLGEPGIGRKINKIYQSLAKPPRLRIEPRLCRRQWPVHLSDTCTHYTTGDRNITVNYGDNRPGCGGVSRSNFIPSPPVM